MRILDGDGGPMFAAIALASANRSLIGVGSSLAVPTDGGVQHERVELIPRASDGATASNAMPCLAVATATSARLSASPFTASAVTFAAASWGTTASATGVPG